MTLNSHFGMCLTALSEGSTVAKDEGVRKRLSVFDMR